jgi:hypothetical protein
MPYSLPGDCWPTEAQTSLLRAALLTGRPAREAWDAWRAGRGDLAGLDDGSKRLLPLLYDRLRAEHIDDPLMPQLKAEFRKTWYQNQATFQRMAGLLAALNEAGIPTIILKGAALAVLHYQTVGQRPMVDFDILVHRADAARVFAVLGQNGWRCAMADIDPERLMTARHSIDFACADGSHFDLHWRLLTDRWQPEADFWAAAVPARVNDTPTLALNPTHQLLHVCAHGAAYNRTPTVRWAADAMQVMRSAPDSIDWAHLVELAGRLRLGEPLHDSLYYLQTRLDAPVPSEMLSGLKALPNTSEERRLYQLRVRRPGLLGDLPLMWAKYAYLSQGAGRPASAAGFIRHLQIAWGLKDLWGAPGLVLHKAMRRLKAASSAAEASRRAS